MGRSRYTIRTSAPHFLTCSVLKWLPVFSDPDAAAIILKSLSFLQEKARLDLYGYVIMENHIHMIADANDLSKEIGYFKSFTARTIIDLLEEKGRHDTLEILKFAKVEHKKDREYQLWQEGSHPELVFGEEMFAQKLLYMHYNPVRRGYVDDPLDWRYSSARNYAGKKGMIRIIGPDMSEM